LRRSFALRGEPEMLLTRPDDLQVGRDATGTVLTISRCTKALGAPGAGYRSHHIGCLQGPFAAPVMLPCPVSPSGFQATLRQGEPAMGLPLAHQSEWTVRVTHEES